MEGGNKLGKDSLGMIDYFGKQKKLFKIHFRNVDKPLPHFVETFVDDGYTDMYKIMKALKKVNFDGVLIADHIPRMINPAPRNNNNNASATVTPPVTTPCNCCTLLIIGDWHFPSGISNPYVTGWKMRLVTIRINLLNIQTNKL